MRDSNKNLPYIVYGDEFGYIKLIDRDGIFHDELNLKKAIEMSEECDIDVVCFKEATKTDLPFCKLINFGKWKYNQCKKKKMQSKDCKKTKEIRIGNDISDHDLDHKVKQAKEFLIKGNDVVFSMLLKGRQRIRFKPAIEKMDSVRDMCFEFGTESARKNISPNLTLRLSPISQKQENK
jgi:translation initiation factor IF-3